MEPILNSSPRKGWVLTQEAFDELLAWLHSDREQAGKKYEDIRNRLVRILIHRGCTVSEDLADRTINLVARRVHEIRQTYVGDPALYFYGVARNVYSEYSKNRPEVSLVPEIHSASLTEESEECEPEYDCLDKCLGELTPRNRELILAYHREKETAKIEYHKEMARELGVGLNALRIRMFRIRTKMKECMQKCLTKDAVA